VPRRRRVVPALALAALVGGSTLLHWLAGRHFHGLWIVPDEPIYASRAIEVWHNGPFGLLHGPAAGYGLLYPVIAGIPLSLGSPVSGYHALKPVQALVVSLAAIPVFCYGRRLMPARFALVAAALTLASPLLLYSGLVMTEVLFYPLAALVLLAIARAVETAAPRDQAVALVLVVAAVLTRTQAVVFVGVFALAAALDAVFARDRSRLRAFWPVWLLVVVGLLVAGIRPGVVGAYAETLRGGYPMGAALRLTFDHLSYIVLSTGVVPFAALVMLAVTTVRNREPDPATRAFVALALAAVAVVVVQIGLFSSRYSPHLLGRDLAALPPLLFMSLSLWLARGAPRPRITVAFAGFAVLAVVLLAPWNTLVTADAFADTFDLTLFTRIHEKPADVVTLFALVMIGLFALTPRRAVLLLPLPVAALLLVASAVAADEIGSAVNARQAAVVGSTQNWIDRRATGDVAFLYGGEGSWPTVWQVRFWNRRIDQVLSVAPNRVPGPLSQRLFTVPVDGRLPMRERFVVAADRFSFVGAAIAHLTQVGQDVTGLTLWRLDGAPRVDSVIGGVQPNGDMSHPATVSVYDCRRGRLELTLLPKATRVLHVLLNNRPILTSRIAGLASWSGTVSVPPSTSSRLCNFTIVPQQLLGSTRIAFVRE
jgi:dolichyl-phosphate-mannose-protein mannosyltransferase